MFANVLYLYDKYGWHISACSYHSFSCMTCSCDSGLVVVLLITTALLVCVAILLFYDFTEFCLYGTQNNSQVCIVYWQITDIILLSHTDTETGLMSFH